MAAAGLRRVLIDDATVESLAPILMKNSRGVAMIRDELAAWVTSANQYKGGKGSDRQFWLSNWAGVPACVDRKGREDPLILRQPFVSVFGCIQPDVLSLLADPRGRADGFLDRILFCYPDGRPAAKWTWDEIPDSLRAPWRDTFLRLLRLKMVSSADGPRPKLVKLASNARAAWKELMDSLIQEINEPDFSLHLRGPWAKLKVYAARLALIVHVIRSVNTEADNQEVDEASVRWAALLIGYFKSHARKVLAAMTADPQVTSAKRVLACLVVHKDLDHFSKADLFQRLRSFPDSDALDAPLKLLVDHRYLRCYTLRRPKGSRGPNRPRFMVNPLWDRVSDSGITELEFCKPHTLFLA